MNGSSMILFATPSFLEGMARVVDIGGTLNEYNSAMDGAQADRLAFLADVVAISDDIVGGLSGRTEG